MQQTSEEKLFALMVAAEEQHDVVRALTDALERDIAARRASHKALDAGIETLPDMLKTSVSNAVQDVVGRLAASAAKPISDAAAPLARDLEAAAASVSSIRKSVDWYSATLFVIMAAVFVIMGLATHFTTRWAVADSRAALVAVSDQLRQLDQDIEAKRTTIVTLDTQIDALRDQIGGLQWDSCNGRYCIRVADDQVRRSSFDGLVKSWERGSEQFVIPQGFRGELLWSLGLMTWEASAPF